MKNNDQAQEGEMVGNFSGSRSYALSGKIMLSAIVILFFVVVLMVCLHLYARWYLLRARRRYLRRRSRNRRSNVVFYVDPSAAAATGNVVAVRGLDESVLKSLPVFTFSTATHKDPMECAVCLSEFEENESGRVLPKCKHSFHIDCIDMWFHSHSTCPLCRSPIEPVVELEKPVDVSITIPYPVGEDLGSTSSSGLCDACHNEVGTSASTFDDRRTKPAAIVVPSRSANVFDDESIRLDSSASHSFRSPMSRMLSFKRILSRERKTVPSPPAGIAVSPSGCASSMTELAIERGRE